MARRSRRAWAPRARALGALAREARTGRAGRAGRAGVEPQETGDILLQQMVVSTAASAESEPVRVPQLA